MKTILIKCEKCFQKIIYAFALDDIVHIHCINHWIFDEVLELALIYITQKMISKNSSKL